MEFRRVFCVSLIICGILKSFLVLELKGYFLCLLLGLVILWFWCCFFSLLWIELVFPTLSTNDLDDISLNLEST